MPNKNSGTYLGTRNKTLNKIDPLLSWSLHSGGKRHYTNKYKVSSDKYDEEFLKIKLVIYIHLGGHFIYLDKNKNKTLEELNYYLTELYVTSRTLNPGSVFVHLELSECLIVLSNS